ncbi:unnamed protein product [Prunus armeniaca]
MAYEIWQVPKSKNSQADALAKLASAINDKVSRQVMMELLTHPSTMTVDVCTVRYEDTWMPLIQPYLTNVVTPLRT